MSGGAAGAAAAIIIQAVLRVAGNPGQEERGSMNGNVTQYAGPAGSPPPVGDGVARPVERAFAATAAPAPRSALLAPEKVALDGTGIHVFQLVPGDEVRHRRVFGEVLLIKPGDRRIVEIEPDKAQRQIFQDLPDLRESESMLLDMEQKVPAHACRIKVKALQDSGEFRFGPVVDEGVPE